jgi:hypothetical protein
VRTSLSVLALTSAVLSLTSAGPARAQQAPPPPLTVPELTGPRSLALSAGMALANGTEALYVNPAALAARKRYVIDGEYFWDQRPGLASPGDRAQYYGGAVVDSVSTPLAAGLSYLRAFKGPQVGNIVQLGLAGPLTDGFYLGFTGKYYSLKGAERMTDVLNMDAGVFWQVLPLVAVGGAVHNLVGSSKDFTTPLLYGAGITVGSDAGLQLTADWRMNTEACFAAGAPAACKKGDPTVEKRSASSYGGGLEYLVNRVVPLRAGFLVDDVGKTKWWSAGIGIVTSQAAIDVGYRQSVDRSSARTIMVAVRGFLPNE